MAEQSRLPLPVLAECLAVCHRCEHRQRANPWTVNCGKTGRNIVDHATTGDCPINRFSTAHGHGIITSVIGIARALTGTGGASQEMIDQRTAICMTCDNVEAVAGVMNRCKLCGCSTWAKIRNADEHCPDIPPKW